MKGDIEIVSVDVSVGLIMAESDRCIHSKKSTIISFSEARLPGCECAHRIKRSLALGC